MADETVSSLIERLVDAKQNAAVERPNPTEPVTIDLFGDGVLRTLRYSFKSIQRLKAAIGKSVMGLRGGLMQIDEEMLPVLVFEGLRHPAIKGVKCGCGFHMEDGESPDVTMEDLEEIPAYAYAYIAATFAEAFVASHAKKKNLPGAPATMAPGNSVPS